MNIERGLAQHDIDPDDRAPSAWLRLGEVAWHLPRVLSGLGPLGARGPEDGPPALVVPGFMASDRTTMELRRGLARGGWRVHPWEMGLNTGAKADTLVRLKARLDAVCDHRKVLLVGWSLGGLYARELARAHPEMVRGVVTLGSPFSGDLKTNNNVRAFYEWIAGHPVDQPPFPRILDKPPVPTLALWSRRDGIVSVRSARGLEGERDREVEIDTTHMGFAVSRSALTRINRVVADFLEDHPA
ncbi:alpha/beta hydrolase [Sphingomonas sp. LY160]|uniref:alpha/beta fold hydrolase n=1 Tax=Sphingomonas sp. LY160 TaxID=3095342 RepID=UPI002ADED956|nr:alpha/beta hydrolase [Sphingomonas sp. LY160]MEA1072256.1 alpha/beta hydrolase [Sphingomonas sp. LY160]